MNEQTTIGMLLDEIAAQREMYDRHMTAITDLLKHNGGAKYPILNSCHMVH